MTPTRRPTSRWPASSKTSSRSSADCSDAPRSRSAERASGERAVSRPGRPGTSTACGRPAPAWRPASRRRGTAGRPGGRRSGRRCRRPVRWRGRGPPARVVMIRPERRPAFISVTRSPHSAPHRDSSSSRPGRYGSTPVAEEDLGAVHVADAGDHRLVHEQPADRGPAAGDAGVGALAVRAASQRVGAEPGEDARRPPRGSARRTPSARGGRSTRSRRPSACAPRPAARGGSPRTGREACRTARGGRARCGRRRRRRGACRGPSRRRARGRRRGSASVKRPWGLVTVDRPSGELAPAGREPGGAACDPRASIRRRPRCRRAPADRRPRRSRRSARRRWRGRARSRSRAAGRRPRHDRARASPVRQAGGRVALDDDRRRTAAGPRVEPAARAAQRPSAATPTASAGDAPWANRRAATCSRICGWASPPIVPNTAASTPSRVAIAGHRVCGGRAPGRYSAGWPGTRLKPRPRLCRLMPVVGSTSHEPKPAALDWIRLTASPEASAVHRYVVSPAAAATGRRPARCEVDEVGPGLDRGQQGRAVGSLVEHVGTVERRRSMPPRRARAPTAGRPDPPGRRPARASRAAPSAR